MQTIKPDTVSVTVGDMQVLFTGSYPMTQTCDNLESVTHYHTQWEFHYLVSGELQLITDRTQAMHQDDILMMPPNLFHAIPGGHHQRFVLSLSLLPQESEESDFSEYSHYSRLFERVREPILFRSVEIREIVRSLMMPQSGVENAHKRRILMAMLFLRLSEQMEGTVKASETIGSPALMQKKFDDSDRIWIIDTFINQNYIFPHITLDQLGQELGVSRRQADRIVRRLFGVGYQSLILKRRMNVGAIMIRQTDIPLAEIASQVGYASYSGFYLAVKNTFGLTPDQMREEARRSGG